MDAIRNLNTSPTESWNPDEVALLRLDDMDPDTSTVRWIVRKRIVEILSKHPAVQEWEHDQRMQAAGHFDDMLFKIKQSALQYMDLATLESRLNDLIKNLHRSASCSPNGSTALSCEMSYDMEPSSSDISCHSALISSGDRPAVSSETIRTSVNNNISVTSSLLRGGRAESHRFLPNSHHRINSSISPNGNFTHCPETVKQNVPVFSNNCTDATFVTFIPSNQYVGCTNSYLTQSSMSHMAFSGTPNGLFNGGPSFATKAEAAGDPGFNPSCIINPSMTSVMPATSISSIGKFENVNQSGIQINRKIHSVTPGSTLGSFMDQDLYSPQGHLLTSNRLSGFDHSQSINNVVSNNSAFVHKEEAFEKWRNVLILYHHSLQCSDDKECRYRLCKDFKVLHDHISHCVGNCSGKDCPKFKKLLAHYQNCSSSKCRLCVPLKDRLGNFLQRTLSSDIIKTKDCSPISVSFREHEQPPSKRSKMEHRTSQNEECPNLTTSVKTTPETKTEHQTSQNEERQKLTTSVKTIPESKMENQTSQNGEWRKLTTAVKTMPENKMASQTSQNEEWPELTPKVETMPESKMELQTDQNEECPKLTTPMKTTPESIDIDTGPSSSSLQEESSEIEVEGPVSNAELQVEFASSVMAVQPDTPTFQVSQEAGKVNVENTCLNSATSILVEAKKLEKMKKGISLIYSFSAVNIRAHMSSLTGSDCQGKQMAEKQEEVCSLCRMENLRFDPPSRYCVLCLKKINPMGVYYFMNTTENGSESQTFFCRKCYIVPGESVNIGGKSIPKLNLMRGENYAKDDDLNERLVSCDKCECLQHQVCGLVIKDDAMETDYTCPTCILQEIENREHVPMLQSKIPGARDLPTTILSDYIEQWISTRLKEERQERANSLGKKFFEVPTAEGLVVRVVSSVVKQLDVKQGFRDIFNDEEYPSKFTYKSKAILLFQNIDGADVCLFGMYVQEYGSKCSDPNKRRVCISYLDSVKHFRPRVTAATGEALRTFVYHELLIGYLDYCKKRGFTSCYIWACPPLKRDDYILYCHPKTQKMPKSDKLREWYQTIIRKALKKEIVVEHTNLHDHFFVNTGECKAKVTAARLPYFDSDYWPGEAEVLLQRENGSKPEKKAVAERVLRAYRRDASIENPKDVLLMYQLGESIRPMKEDFIMIHLWHVCKHCCHPISSGELWACSACRNFKLCKECFLLEQNLEMKDRHPIGTSGKHSFHKVQVEKIPPDTTDNDGIIQSDIFSTRLMFLGHCQNNHYQFDSLRRAKYSTMMILYNLQNQIQSSLLSACVGCHIDLDRSQSWHCLICIRYDLCNSCYVTGAFPHEHELVCNAYMTDSTSHQSSRNKQVQRLQKLCAANLVHASKCNIPHCDYKLCRKLKAFFAHTTKCQTRLVGGCEYCRKTWSIIRVHAQFCVDNECRVPRCKDIRELKGKKNLVLGSERLVGDSHRRAGAKERMRERIQRQKNLRYRKGSNPNTNGL